KKIKRDEIRQINFGKKGVRVIEKVLRFCIGIQRCFLQSFLCKIERGVKICRSRGRKRHARRCSPVWIFCDHPNALWPRKNLSIGKARREQYCPKQTLYFSSDGVGIGRICQR